jgi:hypothetical protein
MARVAPGRRPAHFCGPKSGSTTVFAVEQCELSATGALWRGYLVKSPKHPAKRRAGVWQWL